MKRLILLFFCLLFLMPVFGQNGTADSLSRLLPKVKNDIERADLLNRISDAYKTSDPEKMQAYANQALGLSQKIKYRLAEATAHQNLGNSFIIKGSYAQATTEFLSAQKIFEAEASISGNSKAAKMGLARSLGSLGVVFSEQSNYARALQYDLKAIQQYEKLEEPVRLAHLYNNTAVVYSSQKNNFKALEYLLKAADLLEKSKDAAIAITLTNIGNNYLAQKDFEKALEYYQKAQTAFTTYPDDRAQGELCNNWGDYFEQTNKPMEAETAWQKALGFFASIDDEFGTADTKAHLAKHYLASGDLQKAMANASASLGLAEKLQIPEQVVIAEKLLSDIYSRQGDTKNALLHFERYSVAKDSLASSENIRKSVQAELNYEFDKREAIAKKESEKRELLYTEAAKRHTLQTVFIVLFVLLLAGICFLVYNRRQLKRTLTLQKELAEYEQKALHLQMNPHFVFNCLGSISSFIVQNGTDQAIKYLAKFSKLMRLTLEYSKEQLIPIDREIEGLQNYLELEQLRFNNIFTFDITKSRDIEDDVALPPLLLQPFVENAIIHGIVPKKQGGRIDVDFTIDAEFLICSVTDNGVGIDKSTEMKQGSVPVHKSMALDITRKRLDMIRSVTSRQADVEITQTADNAGNITGTKVLLRLPLQYINK
ncbi:tetratricopeptide repeat-containing sensor histidine kinase [Flavobacterium silvaticum]|uniref:Tetratricopeptide repeat protein n=1 Tax=Flavobacterium silvaticum TaxID=1852020 RepID=A0A972FXP7_9FLAO|nr:tetratricopeptide repeat protein [Flavobacterium silvaticum]NMH29555.1 tetratricopeptide repeat protein [Flavobacterium silvaticum]